MQILEWLEGISSKDWLVFIKRLSANDTGATGAHQVGVYIPKHVLGEAFPSLSETGLSNPDVYFPARVESHDMDEQTLRAIYYNQKTRNEKRITRWATGVDYTPLQDHEMTGALAVFAFHKDPQNNADYLRVWVCSDPGEEETVESFSGPIDPSSYWSGSGAELYGILKLEPETVLLDFPNEWKQNFPSGEEIIQYLFSRHSQSHLPPDRRL